MKYSICPSIGIARVGNSPLEFFIGPETPGSAGVELLADGSEQPLTRYKDASYRVKRQAARFRLFEIDEATGDARPAQLPTGTTVRWTVNLANKKDAVVRSHDPVAEAIAQPADLALPTLDPTRQNRHIRASGVAPAPGSPAIRLSGKYLAEDVLLGELLTDIRGNLVVLGGHGISRSPENAPIGSEPGGGRYYDNRGWYDDVSDGSVSAEILPADGSPAVTATSAWVIVAPPDFAPGIEGVVTLYDVMRQAAIEAGLTTPPAIPSFSRDIWPMLRRAAALRWVNRFSDQNAHWKQFDTDWPALADPSAAAKPRREKNAELLRGIEANGELQNFSLRRWQLDCLQQWEAGAFTNDFTGTPTGAGIVSPDTLTRTALDGGVGQGFLPGIEAGIVVKNPAAYAAPFRIAAHVQPGDLTGLMALPWQADFLKCNQSWWPSQRPDDAPQTGGVTKEAWVRPIDKKPRPHRELVNNFGRLGVVVPRVVNGRTIHEEVDRDPTFI